MPRVAAFVLVLLAATVQEARVAVAQEQAVAVRPAVLDPALLELGSAVADHQVARRWVGEFVETRYADERRGETAYLVRWRAPDPAAVPFRDLDRAIATVFDDPGLAQGRAWTDGSTRFRAFTFGDAEAAMSCVGFARDESREEGTFAVHCATGRTPVDPATAARFAAAVVPGSAPEQADDVIEPPT